MTKEQFIAGEHFTVPTMYRKRILRFIPSKSEKAKTKGRIQGFRKIPTGVMGVYKEVWRDMGSVYEIVDKAIWLLRPTSVGLVGIGVTFDAMVLHEIKSHE